MYVSIIRKDGEPETITVLSISELIKKLPHWHDHSKLFTFDIETTTAPDYSRSWMWVFQVCHEGIVYIGRTWDEYMQWFNCLSKGDRVYIHNLSFEWAFIKDFHKWARILSRNKRNIISARTENGVEFRCTYALTGKSLEKLATDSTEVTIGKQVGSLDYTQCRTPLTKITTDEMCYIVADVYILYQYLHNEFNSMPYTKTGYVRNDIRKSTKKDIIFNSYKKRSNLPFTIFERYKNAFIGGDVHANEKYIGELHHTFNYDITSSYPYRMIKDLYPYGKTKASTSPQEDIKICDRSELLYVATVCIRSLSLASWDHYPVIPCSKCLKRSSKIILSNGRVIRAEFVILTVTSIDLRLIKRNYNFSSLDILELFIHEDKKLLPYVYRERILQFYRIKTELKGVKGCEQKYMLAKENVNSVYGMTVTYPIHRNLLYNNGEWKEDSTPDYELYSEYLAHSSVAPYTIGIWTTAYAREDLDNVRHMSEPVYWDTDSIKSRSDISTVIKSINTEREAELSKLYSIDDYSPKDIKGRRHCIGLWDYEGETELIAWGSKKYGYYTDNGTPHLTVAGLSKKKAQQYLIDNNLSITDITNGTIIPEQYSGRMVASYVDNLEPLAHPDGSTTTDKSCVVLQPTSYTFDTMSNIINTAVLGTNNQYIMGGMYNE